MTALVGRKNWDVIVVGGGPAGLFAGISAAKEGARVLLLEKQPHLGGKLPLSGGGRGNLTHTGDIRDLLQHYHGGERPGAAARFLRPALHAFSNTDLVDFFSQRGLSLVAESDGRVFPKTNRAQDALNVILKELEKLRVEACTEMRVTNVRWVPSGFSVSAQSKRKETFKCRSLVLAAGGQAYPPLGSTDGYALARKLGHQLIPCRPALVPVIVKLETFRTFVECAGIAVQNALVILERAGRILCKKQGSVLFTHRGLSGPAVLDLSREVEPNDVLRVIFIPGVGNFTALE
ncbi:aminoacetone oxidase family FAD-binding enzyme, partial [Candidatus Bipolaricaulota bacterium]|nr:aminoacetone oxidase family FAD-binding enzyme [Candidatus Bipolaricaulota bacterium]